MAEPDATPPEAPAEAEAEAEEQDLQKVEIIEFIADGTSGEVWKGHHPGRGIVAIKKIKMTSVTKAQRRDIARELRILSRVEHPNLIDYIGAVVEGTHLQIIMEFCGGGDLFTLLHESEEERCGPILTWPQKTTIASDVALAMRYLHGLEPPIIHRDLKSLNVLFQEELTSDEQVPKVKVVDFGLSRTLLPGGMGTPLTMGKGTAQWMAPELIMDNKYDEKVDLYSYSMMLYELICEDLPFCDVDAARISLVICKGERPDLTQVQEGCPPSLCALMQQCWEDEPSQRPSFSEVCKVMQVLKDHVFSAAEPEAVS